jgi:hypothetical protein
MDTLEAVATLATDSRRLGPQAMSPWSTRRHASPALERVKCRRREFIRAERRRIERYEWLIRLRQHSAMARGPIGMVRA